MQICYAVITSPLTKLDLLVKYNVITAIIPSLIWSEKGAKITKYAMFIKYTLIVS